MERKNRIMYELLEEAFDMRGFELVQLNSISTPRGATSFPIKLRVKSKYSYKIEDIAYTKKDDSPLNEEDIDNICLEVGERLSEDLIEKNWKQNFAERVIKTLMVRANITEYTIDFNPIHIDGLLIKVSQGSATYRVLIKNEDLKVTTPMHVVEDIARELEYLSSGKIFD